MPNYFTENQDLLFHFSQLSLREVVSILEHQFAVNDNDPLRPESYEQAMEFYAAALELCGDISGNYIEQRAEEIDKQGTRLVNSKVIYSQATLEAQHCLAEAGFMGVIIPRKYGGLHFPATIYIMMIEMVSQADGSMMTMFGYQDVGEAIAKLTSEEVAMQFLPEYCEGKKVGAMVLTEPGGGSDLQAIRVSAQQDESGQWYIDGVKQFISHGNGDVLLVLAKSEEDTAGMFGLSLFAVHGGVDNNVKVARIEEKMGLHGSPTCELHFNHAKAELVGDQKFGLFHVVDILNHARFSVAAQALGIAEGAYLAAKSYAKERKAFGQFIYDMPPVADMLIDMRVTLDGCRAMLYAGTQWLDKRNTLKDYIEEATASNTVSKEDKIAFREAQKMLTLLSPLTKYVVTEAANRVCYEAQQVHGGIGYIREMKVERAIRDVRITTIYEGTTQVQIGLAIKHVLNDVLAKYFDEREAQNITGPLSACLTHMVSLRNLFKDACAIVRNQKDDFYKGAAAKELTDMYASLYAGHLLIESALKDASRIAVVRRFAVKSVAGAQAGMTRISEGLYTDGACVDEICR